jgi:hypothetical protein
MRCPAWSYLVSIVVNETGTGYESRHETPS